MWSAKLTIAYLGANYVGWQFQQNGISVQQRLEEAWQSVTGEKIRIAASGRTDSGVHAVNQVCSCRTETKLSTSILFRALNAQTPEDICIRAVEKAADGFHAIRDAISKEYHYRIQYDSPMSPFGLADSWFVPRSLDLNAMRLAANRLVGEHDFASFETTGSPRYTTIRTVHRLDFIPYTVHAYKFLTLEIVANGFLYNMARTIAGTLVEVGQGTREPSWVDEVLKSRDRKAAGMTAPAKALFLIRVEYPDGHLLKT